MLTNNLAPLTHIHQLPGEITFQVDDVKQASDRLPVEPVTRQFSQRCQTPLLVCSHGDATSVVQAGGNNPLIDAVHLAFSQHRPLVLTPDIIWLTIAQGFAQHVSN